MCGLELSVEARGACGRKEGARTTIEVDGGLSRKYSRCRREFDFVHRFPFVLDSLGFLLEASFGECL